MFCSFANSLQQHWTLYSLFLHCARISRHGRNTIFILMYCMHCMQSALSTVKRRIIATILSCWLQTLITSLSSERWTFIPSTTFSLSSYPFSSSIFIKRNPRKFQNTSHFAPTPASLSSVHHCHFLASLFPFVTIAATWQYEKKKGASQFIEAPGMTNLPSTPPPPCPGEGMLEQATGSACCHDLLLSNCRLPSPRLLPHHSGKV